MLGKSTQKIMQTHILTKCLQLRESNNNMLVQENMKIKFESCVELHAISKFINLTT